MKLLSAIKVLMILLTGLSGSFNLAKAQDISLNVLSYNIRLATPDDAPNVWSHRKENVFNIIRDAKPDIFGLQEALKEQVSDMEKAFPGFTRIGLGRDDGKEAGEYSPVFYNSKRFALLSSGTFWLSQTPQIAGSRGWDAACNRVVSWVQLKEKGSGVEFYTFCTHFDHMGEVARRNSAILLLNSVDSIAGKKPVVVLGDFNSTPGSEPYQIITDKSNPIHLTDSRGISQNTKGPQYTFTGFKVGAQKGEMIDYIFINRKTQSLSFEVNDTNNGEYYPSDHLPVSATLKLF
jgi:endonuclease/exonuclease/phosphatase family metal-dependent hydrolase